MKTQAIAKPGVLPRLSFLCSLAVLAVGCVEGNPAVVEVVGNVVPKKVETGCIYDEAEQFYSEGVLDLSVRDEYRFGANLLNLLPASNRVSSNNEPQFLRPDLNTVTITNVSVQLNALRSSRSLFGTSGSTVETITSLGKSKKALKTSWNVPISVVVKPGGSSIHSFPLIPAEELPGVPIGREWVVRMNNYKVASDPTATKYNYVERVGVTMTFEGALADGTPVKSTPYTYMISVCWGCLLFPGSLTPNAESPTDHWKGCTTMVIPDDYEPPCSPGQDESLLCTHGCALCTARDSLGLGKCDPKFCPPLQ